MRRRTRLRSTAKSARYLAGKEIRHRHTQRLRKLVHVGERDVLFAALDGACVGSVHPGGVGELLLAKSALAAQLAHAFAELAFPPV